MQGRAPEFLLPGQYLWAKLLEWAARILSSTATQAPHIRLESKTSLVEGQGKKASRGLCLGAQCQGWCSETQHTVETDIPLLRQELTDGGFNLPKHQETCDWWDRLKFGPASLPAPLAHYLTTILCTFLQLWDVWPSWVLACWPKYFLLIPSPTSSSIAITRPMLADRTIDVPCCQSETCTLLEWRPAAAWAFACPWNWTSLSGYEIKV